LIIARYPEPRPEEGWEQDRVADFQLVQETIRAIRNARMEKKVTPGLRIPATIAAGARLPVFQSQKQVLAALAYLDPEQLLLADSLAEKPQGQLALVIGGVEVFLPLADLVDMDAERERLQKELAEVESQITRLEELLASPFAERAPAAVVDKERQKLAVYHETAARLREQLAVL